jgi:hypothetical protein
MSAIQKLLSISSDALGPFPERMPLLLKKWSLGPELFALLREKNGFYAFESAMHVFPITEDPGSGLEGWNADSLWKYEYGSMAEGLLFFGEDVFQDQFCISKSGVARFDAESGNIEVMAPSLEAWAELMLADYSVQAGWKLAHEWQAVYGALPRGKRLMPKMPFFLGGQYSLDNLWVGNSLEGMRFKGDLARKTQGLPDGTKIRLKVVD